MNDIKDTIQVGVANGSAIGFSLVEANELLTFISLCLAIVYTVYKFIKFNIKK
jgi:hypothetical protein|tara:strand:+ start:306 stop:464 length:159 start_codon:yes stop_codon:yes gene_type:complete